MLHILLSALFTFILWLLGFLLLFGVIGLACGHLFKKLVPKDQDHLPPHLVFWAPFILGIVIGGINGLHIAPPQAIIAGGDSAILGQAVIKVPWTSKSPLISDSSITWRSSLTQAQKEISLPKITIMLSGKALLGPILGPILSSNALFQAYREDRKANPGQPKSWPRIWKKARPELERLVQIGVLASLSLGFLYGCALGLATLVLIVSANRDLSRPK